MTTERRSAFSERLRSPMTWHWTGIVVLSILVFGLVIFIHELGHFHLRLAHNHYTILHNILVYLRE